MKPKLAKNRDAYVNASEIPAVLGIDRFRSSYDLWLAKRGMLEGDGSAGQVAEIGSYQERAILDQFCGETGLRIRRNQRRVARGMFGASHDALVVGQPRGVEAKMTSATSGWGRPGTDEVPDYVLAQVQFQALVSQLESVYVPVLFVDWGARFEVYEVPADKEIQEFLAERAAEFHECLEDGTPPPDVAPRIETLRRLKYQTGKVVEYDEAQQDAVQFWRDCEMRLEDAQRDADLAKRVALSYLGDAEGANCPRLSSSFSFRKQSRRTLSRKGTVDRCDACGVGSSVSEFRKLNWREGKIL